MNIETKRIRDLTPAEYNPRKDLKPGDPEFEKLKRSIETFGYVEPVIWNRRTGNVVGGHQRLKVMQWLGHDEVECVIDDYADINKMSATEAKRLLKEILQGDTPTTILRENKPVASEDHPTMKPIRLIAKLIRNSSRPGESVLDLFGGSGTTLMAADQLGRRAFLMEYDPRFVDVIVKRWERFTGKQAQKIPAGGDHE